MLQQSKNFEGGCKQNDGPPYAVMIWLNAVFADAAFASAEHGGGMRRLKSQFQDNFKSFNSVAKENFKKSAESKSRYESAATTKNFRNHLKIDFFWPAIKMQSTYAPSFRDSQTEQAKVSFVNFFHESIGSNFISHPPTSKVLYNNYGSQETEAGKYEERDRISVEFHPHI